jgi:enoyl-[acyl-carrier-protein] reductase (NADH)
MSRFADAREVAAAAWFLASDESSYVTASTFMVEGGISGAYVAPEQGEPSRQRTSSERCGIA